VHDDDTETAHEDDAGPGPDLTEEPQAESEADSPPDIEEALDTLPKGSKLRGEVVDVASVSGSAVPAEFPSESQTADALALTIDIEQTAGEATTYFARSDTDSRLGRLLDLRSLDQAADLEDNQLLLTVENDYAVPVVPSEERRGDDRAYAGIIVGLLPSLLIFLGGLFQAGGALFSRAFVAVWLVATFLVLPVSLYFDAWNLRTTTDWQGRPLLWAALSVIPAVNVMAVSAYLVVRQSTEPL
jgi:hypothetical protein